MSDAPYPPGPPDWDERLRRNAARPEPAGLARMAAAVAGRGSKPVSVRRLMGGVDCSTHAVRLEPGGWVVLKVSPEAHSRSLASEAEVLTFAERVTVPSPALLGLDLAGAWFGRPALVMSRLSGRLTWHGSPGPWISRLADTLSAIHAVTLLAELPAALARPHAGLEWRPAGPDRLPRSHRVEALLEAALGLQSDLRTQPPPNVFLHHDLYHRNLLWQRGKLSGVVDWNEGRTGPPACDIAYCSVDIAMTNGVATAKAFTHAAEAVEGQVEDMARWQALWILAQLPWTGLWRRALRPADAQHLTSELIGRRLRSFADHVIHRL